ncbi:MAG: glycerate kinase [Spirochaetales bacterium]|nr:glycerate kinase [Spirochaetales bacterium]
MSKVMKNPAEYRKDLEQIFLAGVERVNPWQMILSKVKKVGNNLLIELDSEILTFNLNDYKQIFVIGAGKATAPMAAALEAILGARISQGIISVKYGHTAELDLIKMIEAGHPVPDENSNLAAKEMADLAGQADVNTLVISLISGGGSALLSLPWSDDKVSLSLSDKQDTTKLLLECGAAIQEINCIRKHISGIKGGRLASLVHPATCINLILSDVIGDRLDSIASGLTVADSSTFAQAVEILDKYGIRDKVPAGVKSILERGLSGDIPDTPKKGDPIFDKVKNCLLGTNRAALIASEKKARELGFQPVILSSRIAGEAREIAKFYLGMALDCSGLRDGSGRPLCLIGGGETTVTLRGKGTGGRNQEMALSFLNEMRDTPDETNRIFFLSGGTDGNDGPTDAAGAYAELGIFDAGLAEGLSIQEYLNKNDSYNYFKQAGGLLMTGPTNTNVCDIQLVIVE